MNTLSNERLEEISQCSDVTTLFAYEQRHMARELLALRKEREAAVPVEQLKNLEHFISFWRKVQSGNIKPSSNEIDHTVWFLEVLATITASPAQPVAVPDMPIFIADIRLKKALLWIDGVIRDNPKMKEAKTCRAAMLKEAK